MTKLIDCYLKTESLHRGTDSNRCNESASIWLTMLLLTAPLSGCSVFQTETRTEAVSDANRGKRFDSVADIICQPLVPVPGKDKTSVVVNEFTARLQQPSGMTPVLAYQIPVQGVHKISIDSYVIRHPGLSAFSLGDSELFYPEIALLDEHNRVISKVDPAHVAYKKPGFTSEEGVGTSFTIDNRGSIPDKTACMLIYTTDSLRKKTTPLINEDKEYARVRGVVPPPIPDPVAQHGNFGHLRIKIQTEEAVMAVNPVVAAPVHRTVTKPVEPEASVPDANTEAIRSHYINGVRSDLEKGKISEALDKRAELKAVTSQTEHYFLKNFGKPASALPEIQSLTGSTYSEKASHTYIQRINHYLKTGKGSAALQLLDEVKQLQSDVDHLFDR